MSLYRRYLVLCFAAVACLAEEPVSFAIAGDWDVRVEAPGHQPQVLHVAPAEIISVAAELVRVHPRTLRIYELEGLICPARTPSNIRLFSENDIRNSSVLNRRVERDVRLTKLFLGGWSCARDVGEGDGP